MASADAKPRRNSITRVRTPKGRGSLKSSSSDLADSSSGKPVTNNTSTEGIRSNRSSISQCTDFSLSNSANSTYNMYEAFQALHTHYPADCSADPPAFPFDSTVELPFDAPDGTIDMEGNYIDELFENYEYRASAESELLEPFSTDFRSAPAPAPLPPPLNISSPIAEPPRKKSFVFNFSSSTARPDASADTVAGAASGPVREPSSLARLFGTANAAFSSPPVSAPSHASALVSSVPAAGVGSCAPSAAVSAVHVPVPAVPLSVLELELAEAESMPVEPSVPDSTGVTCGTGVPTEPEQVDLSSSTSLSSSATSATSAVAGQSADSVAVVAGVNTAPFFPPSSSS